MILIPRSRVLEREFGRPPSHRTGPMRFSTPVLKLLCGFCRPSSISYVAQKRASRTLALSIAS